MKKTILGIFLLLTIFTTLNPVNADSYEDVVEGHCNVTDDHPLTGTHWVYVCDFWGGATYGNKFVITPIQMTTQFGSPLVTHTPEDYDYHIIEFNNSWQQVYSTTIDLTDFSEHENNYLYEATNSTVTYISMFIEHKTQEDINTVAYSSIVDDIQVFKSAQLWNTLHEIKISANEAQYQLGWTDGQNAFNTTPFYNQGFSDGVASVDTESPYDYGFQMGFDEAYNQFENSGGWLTTFLGVFDVVFSIEILPSLTVGLLTAIVLIPPFVFRFLKWVFA